MVSTYARLLVLCCLLVACTHPQTPPPPPAPHDWASQMQRLKVVLTDLLPFVASSKKFNDPASAAQIEADTAELKSLAHALKTGAMPNSDPSMQVVSSLFDDDLGRALSSLKTGNREYARRILSDTTSYCIQCHTQTRNGPEFPRLKLDLEVKDLKPLDRAEFLTATRQFEAALSAYREVLSEPTLAREDSFAFEQAAREALAISVRVHRDPREAAQITKAILKNKGLSPAFTKTVKAWDESIKIWKKEKPPKYKKGEDVARRELEQAETLIKDARARIGDRLDNSEEITFERAASLLHDVLQRPGRSDELTARALFLSGVASEATRETDFWGLHESYYEQCIRTKPATEQAKQCFERLNDSVLAGYSGSSGTHVPPDVEKRLEAFKALAFGTK